MRNAFSYSMQKKPLDKRQVSFQAIYRSRRDYFSINLEKEPFV
jgi:hypothetical protein